MTLPENPETKTSASKIWISLPLDPRRIRFAQSQGRLRMRQINCHYRNAFTPTTYAQGRLVYVAKKKRELKSFKKQLFERILAHEFNL